MKRVILSTSVLLGLAFAPLLPAQTQEEEAVASVEAASAVNGYRCELHLEVIPPDHLTTADMQARYVLTVARGLVAPDTLRAALRSGEEREIAEEIDDKAVMTLSEHTSVSSFENNFLILRVEDSDPARAKVMAAKIFSTFAENHAGESKERARKSLDALMQVIRNQEDEVEQRRKVVDTIVKITGEPYFESENLQLLADKKGRVAKAAFEDLARRALDRNEMENAVREYEQSRDFLSSLKERHREGEVGLAVMPDTLISRGMVVRSF